MRRSSKNVSCISAHVHHSTSQYAPTEYTRYFDFFFLLLLLDSFIFPLSTLAWIHCCSCFLAASSACFCHKMSSHDGEAEELPPPPPLPPDVVPIKASDAAGESPPNKSAKPKRLPMARPGVGKKGQPIQLYSNHFKVTVKSAEDFFFHYHVCMRSSIYNIFFQP